MPDSSSDQTVPHPIYRQGLPELHAIWTKRTLECPDSGGTARVFSQEQRSSTKGGMNVYRAPEKGVSHANCSGDEAPSKASNACVDRLGLPSESAVAKVAPVIPGVASVHIARQLALFIENRPGTLARVCTVLGKAKINIFDWIFLPIEIDFFRSISSV